MNLGIVVLARLSSSRLPGKALMDIGGKPLIKHVLDRISKKFDKNLVVVATSTETSDDRLAIYIKGLGYNVFRGSLENVAERFMFAALENSFDTVVRVTGDSLFADPNIINDLLKVYLSGSYDIVSNRKIKSYPVGQTFEVINVRRYQDFYKLFKVSDDFEHVTNFFYQYEDLLKINLGHHQNPDGVFREISLALDTKEDFEKISQLFLIDYALEHKSYKEIYKLYEEQFYR